MLTLWHQAEVVWLREVSILQNQVRFSEIWYGVGLSRMRNGPCNFRIRFFVWSLVRSDRRIRGSPLLSRYHFSVVSFGKMRGPSMAFYPPASGMPSPETKSCSYESERRP